MKSLPVTSLAFLAITLALSLPHFASAQITEDFSAGHGLAPGGAYVGTATEGWSTAWAVKRPAMPIPVDMDVIDNFPLAPGAGNYLQVSGVATSTGIWGIARQFAPFPNREYNWVRRDQPHRISFLFRVDELTGWSRGENITIGDGQTMSEIIGTGNLTSFLLCVHHTDTGTARADHWALHNGARDGTLSTSRYIDTGIPLRTGVTYSITIQLNPQNLEWRASIADGENSFTSDWLGYRAGGMGTGILAFLRQTNSAEDYTTFSIDSIVIDSLR